MASERKIDPSAAAQARKAGVKAKHEVLSASSRDALINVNPADMIKANPSAEVIKGNAKRAGCWQHAPAQFELYAATDKRLTKIAEWDRMQVKKVSRIYAELVPDTKLLVIKAAPDEDLTAYPVNRYAGNSAPWVNLIALLAEAKLLVDTGYRERFDVAYVPKESSLWPALVVDLGDSKERRVKKKDGVEAAEETQAAGKTKAGAKAAGKKQQPVAEPVEPAEDGEDEADADE